VVLGWKGLNRFWERGDRPMDEAPKKRGLLGRLLDVLRGAETVVPGAPSAAEAANLRQELAERDERIAALEASCRRLEAEGEQREASAREAAALALLEGVAAPLSQLATLRSLEAQGMAPDVADVLRLTEAVQKAFGNVGLEAIGEVGEVVEYDPELHRPVGREQLSAGERARVRFVGFRLGQRTVRPALVSREEG